ncbi:MAG: hypothetical protein RR312_04995 [Bacteroidales bacterium]
MQPKTAGIYDIVPTWLFLFRSSAGIIASLFGSSVEKTTLNPFSIPGSLTLS